MGQYVKAILGLLGGVDRLQERTAVATVRSMKRQSSSANTTDANKDGISISLIRQPHEVDVFFLHIAHCFLEHPYVYAFAHSLGFLGNRGERSISYPHPR